MITVSELRDQWQAGEAFGWLTQESEEDRLVTVPFVFAWCQRQFPATQNLLKYGHKPGQGLRCALSSCFIVGRKHPELAFFPHAVWQTVLANRLIDNGGVLMDNAVARPPECCSGVCITPYAWCRCCCFDNIRSAKSVESCPRSVMEVTFARSSLAFGRRFLWATDNSLHRDALFASGIPDPEEWVGGHCMYNLVDFYWHRDPRQLASLIPHLEEGRCAFPPAPVICTTSPRFLLAQKQVIDAQERGFARKSRVVADGVCLPTDLVHLIVGYTGSIAKIQYRIVGSLP